MSDECPWFFDEAAELRRHHKPAHDIFIEIRDRCLFGIFKKPDRFYKSKTNEHDKADRDQDDEIVVFLGE